IYTVALARASASPNFDLGALGRPWNAAAVALLPVWCSQLVVPADQRALKVLVLAASAMLAFVVARRTRANRPVGAPRRLASALGATAVVVASLVCTPRALLTSPPANAPVADGPNVVLVVLDTVRADHCSLYGYARETTPGLARFAADAQVFERAYSTSAVTLASHASLFTGLHALEHGAHSDELAPTGRPLATSHATLAELLAARGYDTAAFVANHGFLSPVYGLQRGFAHYDARPPRPELAPTPPWVLRRALRELAAPLAPRAWRERAYRGADEVLDATLAWLATTRERPYFAFVNLMDAHAPCVPPAPFDRRFASAPSVLSRDDLYSWRDAVNSGARELDPEVRDELVARYDGGIAFADAELERLWDALRASGELERTLIVITSDHGEAFGEHGQLFHNATVFEEEVGVPLVIRAPRDRVTAGIAARADARDDARADVDGDARADAQGGARAGASVGARATERTGVRERALASGVDLVPTVLDALGLEPRPGLSGRSLLRPPNAPLAVLVENRPIADVRRLAPERLPDQRALVRDEHAWIESFDGRSRLFDLARDPGQRDDLVAREPELARAFAAELADFRARLAQPTSASRRPAKEAGDARDARDALERLGYAR
ncbi:MAG: sulfatase, partial [Planctomycetes bacterium]|nr:sulfatase [Planctomycetota bacterium]